MAALKIFNPVAQSSGQVKFHAAKRVADLGGKRIGVYDNNKPRGDVAQKRLMESLGARLPRVTFKKFSGTIGGRSTLTAKGATEIAKECDAVIGIRAD